MVDLTKYQIIMANLTNCKSQRPLSMVNLIKTLVILVEIWSFFTRCLVCQMAKNVILVKCFS